MTKSIWEFPLKLQLSQTVSMPVGSVPLTVQVQRETLCLWAWVDPSESRRADYPVWIHGTGHIVSEGALAGHYLGTVQMAQGALVLHVIMGPERPGSAAS